MAEYTDAEGFNISSNAASPAEIREAVEIPEKPEKTTAPAQDDKTKPVVKPIPPKPPEKPVVAKTAEAKTAEEKTEPTEPDEDESTEEPKGRDNPNRNPTARMLKATKEASELRHRLEAERAETAQLKTRLESLEKIAQQVTGGRQEQDPRIPPNVNDYEDVDAYNDARMRWMLHQELEHREGRARVQQEVDTYIKDVGGKIDAFKSKYTAHPDREKVQELATGLIPSIFVEEGQPKTANNGLADALILAEDPVSIMVYLTEHSDELEKVLGAKNQAEIDRRLARIETIIELESKGEPAPEAEPEPEPEPEPAPTRKISQAKPPVKPLPTRSGKNDADLETMPIDEYIATMNRRDMEKKRNLM